jgi:hypothetical protein
MQIASSLMFLLALLASPAPSPSTARAVPKTIIIVVSSPYCKSLADHFNGALVPMLANDHTLDGVSVQLDSINTLFSQPDYVEQFLRTRDALGREETALNQSLAGIQSEINQLRDGSKLTTDAKAASEVHDAAADLQTAYDHQRQLAIDLQGMYEAMLQYPISRVHPAMGNFDPADMFLPSSQRDVRSYLRFNGQRDIISDNENSAADKALDAATTNCVKTK